MSASRRIVLRCLTRTAILGATLMLGTASPANAAVDAASADDLCAPDEDPCVVNQIVNVTGDLDFGLRRFILTGGGRLRGDTVRLVAGSILIDVGPNTSSPAVEAPRGISLGSRGRCADLPAIACGNAGPCGGACDVESATVVVDGRFTSRGGDVSIGGAGDVTVNGRINVSGLGIAESGGSVYVESENGDVLLGARVNASSSDLDSYDFGAGGGGTIEVVAEGNVTVTGVVDFTGISEGGESTFYAGQNVTLQNDIDGRGGSYSFATGGRLSVKAAGNLSMNRPEQVARELVVDLTGGGVFYGSGYGYGYWYSGYGGEVELYAEGQIEIGRGMALRSDSGPGYGAGGYINVYALDDINVGGRVLSRGTGAPDGGLGGDITLDSSNGDISIEATGIMDVSANEGRGEILLASSSNLTIDGRIDMEGIAGFFDNGVGAGGSGALQILDGPDLDVSGDIIGGGTGYGIDSYWETCRTRLRDGALVDLRRGPANSAATRLTIGARESLVIEDGARILTDATYGVTALNYRSGKPPSIEGIIDPAPVLSASPGSNCAVCGNNEVDFAESCDDGNTVGGDGCSATCQDESCLAATIGGDDAPLCNDADACTAETCAGDGTGCRYKSACADEIACTVDNCTLEGECSNTPDDGRCDDANDCTDDLCAAAGCVHADLNDLSCDDRDPCSETEFCAVGECVARSLRRSDEMSIRIGHRGPDRDKVVVKGSIPVVQFTGAPDEHGLNLSLLNSRGDLLWSFQLAAATIRDVQGDGTRYRQHRPRDGGVEGVRLRIERRNDSDFARVDLRIKATNAAELGEVGEASAIWQIGDQAPWLEGCSSAWRLPCRQKGRRTTCR